MRKCKDCGKLLDESAFQPRYACCKECYKKRRAAINKKWYSKPENKAKHVAASIAWSKQPDNVEKRKEANRVASTKWARTPLNKERKKATNNEWVRKRYATDAEYRQWAKNRQHNRRAGMVGTVTAEDWLRILERFNNRCAYCGITGDLQQDHVIPISKGGHNEASNIVPACNRCNASKNASDMRVWYEQQPFFNQERLAKIMQECCI